MASELHLGDSNWKFFQVGYPVDTPTDILSYPKIIVSKNPQARGGKGFGTWPMDYNPFTAMMSLANDQ